MKKFADPLLTARSEKRAHVAPLGLRTLWFNTGTLCNIACAHCYIESSPTNDRLLYLTRAEVAAYLDELEEFRPMAEEAGFTGGEPFMNPDILGMLEDAMARGFRALVLTNAMRPMMRPRLREGLVSLRRRFGNSLILRVSLDHYAPALHDAERGEGGFQETLKGLKWLAREGFALHVAGRTCWGEEEEALRQSYAALFREEGVALDAFSEEALVLFPEMDETADVPEITEGCWKILGVKPEAIMCADSRMVVKRKGSPFPVVLSCTLLPYDSRFEMGRSLKESQKPVSLNHPHCARFCVLGGGACS